MKKVTLATVLLALALLGGACSSAEASVNAATVTFHFSRFEPRTITVRAGEPITFTLDNQDPIEHEWIVGTAEVHERHRTGTEPHHDSVPTEVTVPALSVRTTTVTFEKPGSYQYICHLPSHEQYGMRGTIRVVAP